jgi:hypothetical protein
MNFELLPILTDYEISMFSHGGHLAYRTALTDTILKGDHQGSFQQSFVEIGPIVSEEKIFLNFIPPFSNLHNRSKSVKVQS